MRKTDNLGTYTYVCDGTSPGADVLSDSHLSYTPGLSQTIGIGGGSYASHFYLTDMLGSVHNMTDASQNNTDSDIYEAFGATVGQTGSTVSPFRFGGGNGYQSDADTGLLLLGHRFYNCRIGRFISQDPAGAGNNWYAYCGNNPVKSGDPSGEQEQFPGTDESAAHDGIMGFIGDVQRGGAAADAAWQTENVAEEHDQEEYAAYAAYNVAWKEATTPAAGSRVISTDTPVAGGSLEGVQSAAYSAADNMPWWQRLQNAGKGMAAFAGVTKLVALGVAAVPGGQVPAAAMGTASTIIGGLGCAAIGIGMMGQDGFFDDDDPGSSSKSSTHDLVSPGAYW